MKHETMSVLGRCSQLRLSIFRNRAERIKAGDILEDYFSLPLNFLF